MCAPCEASRARLEAARTLHHVAKQSSLSDALRKAFQPDPIPPEMWALLEKF